MFPSHDRVGGLTSIADTDIVDADDLVILFDDGESIIKSIAVEDFLHKGNVLINSGNTGSFSKIHTKTVQIGDWNMDSTSSVNVAHSLTAADIRSVSVVIRDDTPTNYYPLGYSPDPDGEAGYVYWDSTNIVLTRGTSQFFDSTSFDSTSYNRGWVTITYEG